MKVSVITVCFNSAATIASTLDSVDNQTWPDIEHWVIDGASRDRTLAIVDAHSRPWRYVLSEKDNGIYDAMNKGVRLATGDVVVFLNADDFYKDAGVVARVVGLMQDEQLDALYGDVEFFRPDRRNEVARRYNSGRFTVSRLAWGWMPAHPALFMRRSLFERYGGFQTDYRIAADFEFIARVFKNRDLRHRHLPETLVRMQLGGVSTSGWRATLRINREMMRACKANGIRTNWFKMLARYPLKAVEFLHV